MMITSNFGFARARVIRAAALFLAFGLSAGALDRTEVTNRGSRHANWAAAISVTNTTGSSRPALSNLNNHLEVRRYIMDFDGDHSLDVATVIEQVFAGSARYTVQLHLASG